MTASQMQTLDGLCERSTGVVDPRRSPADSFAYIDISSVDNERKRIAAARTVLGLEAPSRARQLVRAGDVLVATTRPNLNAVALVPPELDGQVCSTGFCVLRAKPEVLDSHYLFAFVQSEVFYRPLSGLVKGALYPAVTDSQVRCQQLPVPAIEDQRRIANRLGKQLMAVERARAAAEVRVEAARKLESASLREAFLGITPLTAEKARDQAPEGWRWRKLADLARLESGHTPSRYHPEWWGGGAVPWIALPDIRALDGKLAMDTLEHTNDLGIANSSARILPAGTVVLSRTASVGFVTVMGREMSTSQDFVNWVCGPDLDSRLLALLLRASRRYIRSLSSGAVHKTVYMPTVKAFEVCVPALKAQRRIAKALETRLKAAERACAAADGELAAINALPAALLREAFGEPTAAG